MGFVAVASTTKVTRYPRSPATRVVVSTHCSVRIPQTVRSRIPRSVRSCCRLVVVKALCEVLASSGSPSSGRSSSITLTWPRAGSKTPPLPGSACSTHTTRSPSRRARRTSRPTRSAICGSERLPPPLGAEGLLDIDDDQCAVHASILDAAARDGSPHRVRRRNDPVSGNHGAERQKVERGRRRAERRKAERGRRRVAADHGDGRGSGGHGVPGHAAPPPHLRRRISTVLLQAKAGLRFGARPSANGSGPAEAGLTSAGVAPSRHDPVSAMGRVLLSAM